MNDGYSDVLSKIASSSPTPGGGSVAALALAHAHSLALMVSRLTLGKDKWSSGHSSASQVIDSSTKGLEHSLTLADKDALAFDSVMDSYRLPRGNDDQKIFRSESIISSTIFAASVPLEIMRASTKLSDSIIELSRTGNSNALTDLLASSELAHTSSRIASFNIRINLDSLSDSDEKNRIFEEMEDLLILSMEKSSQIKTIIMERLEWV
jgi:formiminotetrahydrofolate cyclodeaminase